MISDFFRKYDINPFSFTVIFLCLTILIVTPFFLRDDFSQPNDILTNTVSTEHESPFFLNDADYEKSLVFELDGPDAVIDLKFIGEDSIYALTYDNNDLLCIYRLDTAESTVNQAFSVFMNPGEDYCNLSKLNNGGYAFTTTHRVIYLNRELKPQTELMLPLSDEDGRYDCIVSPSGEYVAYINSNGLFVDSVDFNSPKLLVPINRSSGLLHTICRPRWVEKGTSLMYFEETEESSSLGFISPDGSDGTVLSPTFADSFIYTNGKHAFFIAPNVIEIISIADGEKRVVKTDGINVEDVVSDIDGRRLIIIGADAKTGGIRYDVLNLASLEIKTAFILKPNINAPRIPMAVSVNGLLAAHVESDLGTDTVVFMCSVKEVV